MTINELTYFEKLQETGLACHHEDAFSPNGSVVYYRILKHNPPVSDDFLPTKIQEGKHKPDSCVQKAVSVSDSLEGLLNGYFKTPAHKKKKRIIGKLTLKPEDGKLKQTFAAGHHSWWRSQAFNPVTVSVQEVEA